MSDQYNPNMIHLKALDLENDGTASHLQENSLPSAWPHNGTLHEQGSDCTGPGLSCPIVWIGSKRVCFAF